MNCGNCQGHSLLPMDLSPWAYHPLTIVVYEKGTVTLTPYIICGTNSGIRLSAPYFIHTNQILIDYFG